MQNSARINAKITSVGHYVPDFVIDNKFFEGILDTSDEWITERTGIKERRWLTADKPTSFMAEKAIKQVLENRGIGPEDIDMIIVGTVTPDMIYPSTACLLQEKIGAKNIWGFDILAACSGFIFALINGVQFIQSGNFKKVLVVGADKMSAILNIQDRNSAILFGDAAGAVLLEPEEDKNEGIIDWIMNIDGSGAKNLFQLGGGSLYPASHQTVDDRMHFVYQEGRTVFKDAVKGMADVSYDILEENNLKGKDVAWLVPHQANHRIITATAERMGLSMDKVMVNINKYGNTTAGTIPTCISEYWQAGKVNKGDYLVLSSFGAGYTWGSVLLKWSY
ncbi:ketoacyl-ACP synthase III [Ignavibacteria bacterium CHB1]|nr:MAG: ketoacyl-ACP synthase III [Chlorobiota bacterium]MBV6398991.1 3-oxoacyl-[acyl-carrier-protein] synthase 3 [Ignavibacteria bacterium]MCC6886172.1 ketoacyl-ACP synthase III [Ignavibacteriales bacterium]MCE7953897.1 ketoacyl-ACP synthase III [Chlorobi bacterium CHB7]MDL1887787.1 ketoacyl-ACP synthase III [Ignavibacteria bacterium CHB1]RIK47838.1 MAG: 3-oxoacyl-ACP synthase [Ignavibacteriota bacterium]